MIVFVFWLYILMIYCVVLFSLLRLRFCLFLVERIVMFLVWKCLFMIGTNILRCWRICFAVIILPHVHFARSSLLNIKAWVSYEWTMCNRIKDYLFVFYVVLFFRFLNSDAHFPRIGLVPDLLRKSKVLRNGFKPLENLFNISWLNG